MWVNKHVLAYNTISHIPVNSPSVTQILQLHCTVFDYTIYEDGTLYENELEAMLARLTAYLIRCNKL